MDGASEGLLQRPKIHTGRKHCNPSSSRRFSHLTVNLYNNNESHSMQAIGVALLLGLLWWQGKLETNANIQDQQGLLFYICIFWTTFSMWTTLMTFPTERQYLAKERAADMYRLSAYYLSSTISDGLAQLVYPTLFLAIVYFMTGLRRSLAAFLYTLLATFLIGITGQACPSNSQKFQTRLHNILEQ